MVTKKLLVMVLATMVSTSGLLWPQAEDDATTSAETTVNATSLIAPKASESTPFAQALVDQAARLFDGAVRLYYSYDVAAYLGLLDEAVHLKLYDFCKDSQAPGMFALKRLLLVNMSPEATKQYIRKSVVLACQDPQYKDLDGRPTFTSQADVDTYIAWLINHSSHEFYNGNREMTLLQYATWLSFSNIIEAYMDLGANPSLCTEDCQMLPAELNAYSRDNTLKIHEHIDLLLCKNASGTTESTNSSAN